MSPEHAIPIIGLGVDLYQDHTNRKFTREVNEQNRQFTRNMYDLQRQHALDDFNRANEYNSPIEQMNRLRQAGLNPHLIYGKGATHTADMVRSVNAQSHKDIPQQTTIGNSITKFLNAQQMVATTDNLHQQNQVLQADVMLKKAQAFKTLFEGKNTKLDYGLKSEARNLLAQNIVSDYFIKGEELNKINAENRQLEARIKHTNALTALEQYKLDLYKQGVNPTGNMWPMLLNAWLREAATELKKTQFK